MVQVVAALIWNRDKFLACQRPAHKARGLLWEFVGGKVETGESKTDALKRECREELDILVEPEEEYYRVIHKYPDIEIELTLYKCHIASGNIRLLEHADARWVHPSQIPDYDFCPDDTEILEKIQKDYL